MDEIFDNALLAQHGYSLDDNNALRDANGGYLESVTIDGSTMTSAIGQTEFDNIQKKNEILADVGFVPDSESQEPSYIQEEQAISNHYIEKYREKPTETTIPQEVLESTVMQEEFEKDRQKRLANGEPAYTDPDAMIEGEEIDTFLADIPEELRPYYKDLVVQRKALLEKDSDYKSEIEEVGEDFSDVEVASDPRAAMLGDLVGGIVDFTSNFFKTGYGMDDEEKKAKLLEVDKEIHRIEQPFAINTIEEIDQQLEDIKLLRDEAGFQGSLELDLAVKTLEKEKWNLEDFVGGSDVASSVFSGYNVLDQTTRGLVGLIAETPAEIMLKNKINKGGKELSPAEDALAKAFATQGKIGQAKIKQSFIHELQTGVNESLKFVGFGKWGRSGGKYLAGKIVGKTLKHKSARGLVNVGTQAVTHPNTYSAAASEYSGNITEVENSDGSLSFTTDRHTFDNMNAELDMNLSAIEEQMEVVKGDTEATAYLTILRDEVLDAKNSIETNEPLGLLGSLGYGVVESAKEAFSETYFGPMMGKIGSGFMRTGAGKYLSGSTVGKWANSSNSALKQAFNKKWGQNTMPGQKLIGGNFEEWGEEVFVQLLPSVGTNLEEYQDQLGELLTMDFHQKVIAQTLVMNKGAQALGWSSQNWDRYKGGFNVLNKNRKGFKKTYQERKALKQTIKSLGDINQSAASFNVNLMGTGEGSFNMADYNLRIKDLKDKGLFEEAGQLERDKIYKQAVAAVQSGNGKAFQKAMVKAQFNNNLSAETKAAVKAIDVEMTEIMDDSNTYLNSNTILDLKSRQRFAKQSIRDINKAQAELTPDMQEISEELAKVGLTLSDVEKITAAEDITGEETIQERLKMVQKRLSPASERYLLLGMVKADTKESIAGYNKSIKEATSQETQMYLQKQNKYSQRVSDISFYSFAGGNMTAKEFIEIVAPALKKSAKTEGLTDDQLNDMNKRIHDTLLADEIEVENSRKTTQSAVNNQNKTLASGGTTIVTPTPVTVDNTNVANTISSVEIASEEMQRLAKEAADNAAPETKDNTDDFEINNNSPLDFALPMELENEDTILALQVWAEEFEKENGRKPEFKDYWQGVVTAYGDKHIFDKESLQWVSAQWGFAGLAVPSWEGIWKDNYVELNNKALALFQGAIATMRDDKEVTTQTEQSQKQSKDKVEPPAGVSASTGSAISMDMEEKTMNHGKTTTVTPKGNFSGVKYMNVETVDGEVIYHKKEDTTEEVPALNTESHLDVKELLHKDKNQPGDVLDIRISDEADWDNPKILVSVNNPVSGKASAYITFAQWIKDNQPAGMTLAEFRKTDEFISKVPIFYVGSNGKDVMHVPDTDWYNPLNVLDGTEDVSEVDINNPNPQLVEDIRQGKESTLELRKKILSGDVTKSEILTKEGSPFIYIPFKDKSGNTIPAKTLEEVANDNPIVSFNGVNFVDLNNEGLGDEVVILNKEFAEKAYKDAKGSSYQTYYLSPIYKKNGVQHYMAIGVLRKDENGENQANNEDVQTAKWIMAANNVIHSGKAKFNMTVAQAQDIRKMIIKQTGMDIRNLDNARELANSLIALSDPDNKTVYSAYEQEIPVTQEETVNGKKEMVTKKKPFLDALFFGGYTAIQNTSLKKKKSHGLSVKKEGSTFKVEKVGKGKNGKPATYEDYLRSRLSTNVMSYNMGTEEAPANTISVQPTMQMKAVETKSAETTQEKEKTKAEVEVTTPPASEKVEGPSMSAEDVEAKKETEDLLRKLNSLNKKRDSDEMLPSMEDVTEIEKALTTIGGLSSKSQREVINNIVTLIVTKFDPKAVSSIGKYYENIKEEFDKLYKDNIKTLTEAENKMAALVDKFPNDEGLKSLLANVRATQEEVSIVADNFKEFFSDAFAEAQKRGLVQTTSNTDIKEDIDRELEDHITSEMYGKDLYKSSNETIHKDKITVKLKRIFSSISTGKTGFLGTPIAEDYDMMYNAVATILSNPLPTDPSFEAMMARLKMIEKAQPWVTALITQLENAEQDTKNAFVSNMYKYAANAKFVNFNVSADGVSSSVWFSNANNVKQKIKASWVENFKRSGIVEGDNLDPKKLKELTAQFESWGDDKWEANEAEQRAWLAEFGIELEDASWQELKDGKLVVGSAGQKPLPMPFSELFMKRSKGRSKELFYSLYKFAQMHQDKEAEDLDYTQNASLVPFKDMNNIMKGLIAIESMHNTKARNITRRDGDKTVSEIVFPGFFLESINKLIRSADTDQEYLEDLRKIAFSNNSLLLDLLINEPEMSDIFSYGEVGLMSLKNEFKKSPKFSKVDQISPIDYIFHQRAMFQDMKVEKIDVSKEGFQIRVATMSTPTSSDKGRMMTVKTGVYDFYNTDLAFDPQKDMAFTAQVKDLLYQSLVVPELSRILNPIDNTIKNYDKGASRFNMLPVINTLKNKAGVSALDFLTQNAGMKDLDVAFKQEFKDAIMVEVEKQMMAEADALLTEEDAFYKENGHKENGPDLFNNTSYISREANLTSDQKRKAATLDYILNTNIHNMNMMQTIIGDPALYFKSDLDPKSANPQTQNQISKDLGVNLGKRLALMIAPGVTLAESTNEKFIQLFLKDNSVVAPNMEEIIGWHYGKKALKEVDKESGKTYQTILDEFREGKGKDSEVEQLKLKFKSVAKFLDIENTDAQEYTTLREHLRVLEGLGRLTIEKRDQILDQVYGDNPTPLTKEDLEMVLQPMKPVYTGDRFETDEKGNPTIKRTVYIKSSSFPLIPELVGENSPLYGLMKKMEELEDKHGKKVRASYQSANKVGAMDNTMAIDPLNPKDLAKLDIANDKEKGESPAHSLLLNRQDFKIQQDVPYKSDKPGDDTVSMGTQIFKLLFGDGISDINAEGFDGRALQEEFHKVFNKMVELNRAELVEELGLNEDYSPKDKRESMIKLQRLLKSEAEKRNFSENDVKSFDLASTDTADGKVYHFKQPLWLSGESNKIEAMFNAIINNKIFKQKLPGNAFVVGSNNGLTQVNQEDYFGNEDTISIEQRRKDAKTLADEDAGFRLQEDSAEFIAINERFDAEIAALPKNGKNTSQVVYIGDYKGGELQGTDVLAPSKIKIDGKLVDLFEVNKEGDHIYLNKAEDGSFTINEQMIDPVLFENFVFRTPTSSHGSGSNIRIVGFVPAIMGDLLITPSNFVTQMGQDFDIDKLTAYQYHHMKDETTGKIEKLNQSHIDGLVKKAQDSFNKASDKYRVAIREGRSMNSVKAALEEFDKLMEKLYTEEEYAEMLKTEKSGNGDPRTTQKKLKEKLDAAERKVLALPREMDLKIQQNKFIEIHNKIYNSGLAEIQKKINKVLSMDVAEDQAEAIDNKASAQQMSVNLLSPLYQMEKLISGSTGGDAIGIYAKGVTFNSLVQQMKVKLRLMTDTETGPEFKKITIGNIHSNGEFGNLKGISKKGANPIEIALARSVAEALDERVNTGTDNEKAQILGRVGITHSKNVAVDNLLTLLGVDLEINQITEQVYNDNGGKENKFQSKAMIDGVPVFYTQYSIPYLLHSQPIIKEFFKRIKNSRSIIGEFSKDAEKKIFKELVGDYVPGVEAKNSDLTGEVLVNGLGGDITSATQKQVLTLYKGLMEDAENLKELNQIVDQSNLGKSMWNSKDKIEMFRDLITGKSKLGKSFSNPAALLGTHNRNKEGLYLGEGDYFVPTTNQGSMVGTALSLARNLFFNYYPYYNNYISNEVKVITDVIGKKPPNPEDQEYIFQEIKKLITSSNQNGIYQGDPDAQRDQLFNDREDNVSLSTYISGLLISKEDSKGVETLKNNLLVSSMSYTKGINGEPSLIKFDNTAAGNISDEDYHIAMKELLVSNESLPDRNGEPFTTRMLAQELIQYSYLSGGVISEAIQFHKFIPIEYYDQIGVTTKSGQQASITRVLQQYNPLITDWSAKDRLHGFTTQFFQNNPNFAKKFDSAYTKKYIQFSKDDQGLVINDPTLKEMPLFVSMPVNTKEKGKANKWKLYENIPGTVNYKRVEVVGTFGMSEYSQGKEVVESVIPKGEVKAAAPIQQQVTAPVVETAPFTIETGDDVKTLLERVKSDNAPTNPALSEVATTLLDLFGDKAMEIKVVVDPNMGPAGTYNTDSNTLTINPNGVRLAETFVHEFVHSVTSGFLNGHTNAAGTQVLPTAPQEVKDLFEVYDETRAALNKKFPKEAAAFKTKYDRYKSGDKTVKFTPREISVFYPTINIKEYLAVSLSNNTEFIEETSKIKYKTTNISISKKFSKVMQRLFNLMAGKENTLGQQIINMNLQFLEKRAVDGYKTIPQAVSASDAEWAAYQAILGDPFLQVPPPDVDLSKMEVIGEIESPAISELPETSLMPPVSIKYTNFEIDNLTMPDDIKPCKI